uniref:Uncharacterized protein n=1 Tax=Anguilla anguilla TaxID=7936 RepID=A0A0E9R1I9_ANGAN
MVFLPLTVCIEYCALWNLCFCSCPNNHDVHFCTSLWIKASAR